MNEDTAKAYNLIKETWREIVRTVAPEYNVDVNQVLAKAPTFAVDPAQQQEQIEAAVARFSGFKIEDVTLSELLVLNTAHTIMRDILLEYVNKLRHSAAQDELNSCASCVERAFVRNYHTVLSRVHHPRRHLGATHRPSKATPVDSER